MDQFLLKLSMLLFVEDLRPSFLSRKRGAMWIRRLQRPLFPLARMSQVGPAWQCRRRFHLLAWNHNEDSDFVMETRVDFSGKTPLTLLAMVFC